MNCYDIIKRPVLTEKSYAGVPAKVYTFEVAKSANKVEIAKAVEVVFGVKVASVNTSIVKGKTKRIYFSRMLAYCRSRQKPCRWLF